MADVPKERHGQPEERHDQLERTYGPLTSEAVGTLRSYPEGAAPSLTSTSFRGDAAGIYLSTFSKGKYFPGVPENPDSKHPLVKKRVDHKQEEGSDTPARGHQTTLAKDTDSFPRIQK